jgi:hypothetical protein
MDFEPWIRLLVLIAMVAGAWRAWKAMPKPVKHEGRKYYPQPDGSFRTIWGRRVRDPALLAALGAAASEAQGRRAPEQ